MGPSIRMPGPNVHKVQADLEYRWSFHRPFVRFLYLKRHFNVWPTHSREQRSQLSIIGLLLTGCQVTGSTGFIGCHIVEQLLESGYRVRAYVTIVDFQTLGLPERQCCPFCKS